MGKEGNEARCTRWIGHEHGERGDGLEREVDGKGVFLKCGELRAREHFKGDDTGDEGLKEGTAEESTIARMSQIVLQKRVRGRADLSRWYVAGFLNEYEAIVARESLVLLTCICNVSSV